MEPFFFRNRKGPRRGRESLMTPPNASPARNAEQLREQIDRGETGDKVDFPDPAMAPLGTDDEAAGHPPRAVEAAPQHITEQPAIEAGSRKPSSGGRVMVLILSVAAVTALALVAVVLV
jgi:hypothetical protein